MPSTIPAQLVTVFGQAAVTSTYLLKIGPTPSNTYLRMTSANKDEDYDDGSGEGVQKYYAATSIQLSTLEASNDLSVVNGEAQSLVTLIPDTGITVEMVERGEIDTVEFVVYEHDFLNGGPGEHRIHASGVLGRCKVVQGLLVIPELRAWTQLLDQNGLISKTSITCRSRRFGSQEGEEREYCGYDVTAEWRDFVVTAVGSETVREFTIAADSSEGLEETANYYAPGLTEWTEGDNAGYSREVEAYAADGQMSLRFTLPKPVQVGDRGRIRRDCTRKWIGHNSCDTFFSTTKGAHFRGEPNIPIGNTMANSIPGTQSPTTIGSGE